MPNRRTTPRARPARTADRAPAAEIIRRLTPRDRWLLRMLLEHTILTTPQLHRLGFARSLRMTQFRLRSLHTLGLVDHFQLRTTTGAGHLHHLLGPAGAQVIAAEEGIHPAQLGWRHDRALAAAHRHTLAHDTGVADLVCAVAADLTTSAATTPGLVLTWWWSELRCGRYFGHHIRPDAYLALHHTRPASSGIPPDAWPALGPSSDRWDRAAGGLWWEAFLEYDTGTEALAVLAGKIHGYHRLAAASGIVTPLLIWTARPGREPGARTALAHTLRTLSRPDLVPVATAAGPTTSPGPGVGRVWLPLTPHTPPGHTAGPRLTLAELAATSPAPIGHPLGAAGHPHSPARQPVDPRRLPAHHHGHRYPGDGWPDLALGLAVEAETAGGVVGLPAPPPLPPRPGWPDPTNKPPPGSRRGQRPR